jgi:hypothetical protein
MGETCAFPLVRFLAVCHARLGDAWAFPGDRGRRVSRDHLSGGRHS